MSYDYLKGSKARKPLGQPVPMDRTYHVDLATPSPASQDALKESYDKGWHEGYGIAAEEVKGCLTPGQVLKMLEGRFSSKHGKTIAAKLREEWGMEDDE